MVVKVVVEEGEEGEEEVKVDCASFMFRMESARMKTVPLSIQSS